MRPGLRVRARAGGRAPEDGAAGILWISIAFAGTLALGRTFERERQFRDAAGVVAAPAARPAIYVGKLLGIVALLLAAEIVLVRLWRCCFRRRCAATALAVR
jgi:ABC-type transport system involved in cytochrome c biogenesis permease component